MKTLSNVANIIDSLHSTPTYTEDGLPMVRVVDIKDRFIELEDCIKVDKASYNKHITNYKPRYGDIVITRVGSFGVLGRVELSDLFCLGQNIAIINPSVDDKYLYYYLKSPYAKRYIFGNIGGSAYKSLSLEQIRKIPYLEPPKSKPETVGAYLYSIDKLIATINKINYELEQTARLIYDYWFTQFDFPDENGKPYKSAGGAMIYNDKLKREIPTGWTAVLLKNIIEFEKGTEPGAAAYSDIKKNDNYITFYRVGDIDGDSKTFVNSTAFRFKLVNPSDVIVTFDGSVGKIGIGLDGAISGGLRHIYDKTSKIDNSVIYLLFSNQKVQAEILKYSTGSVLMHASKAIDYLTVPFNIGAIEKFQSIVKPMFDQMIINRQESAQLAQLRDWLLPMLMNGQVKITD